MKVLMVDANSVGFAAQSSAKLHADGKQVQAIFGFLRTMRKLRETYPGHTPFILWDARAEWRFKLHPLYKSNRKSNPTMLAEREAYQAQRPEIAKALATLGVRQVTCENYEADDLAGYFVSQIAAKPENEVVLISGDEDWLQLVRRNVSWHDIRNSGDKKVDANNFYEKTGCKTPFAFLETKILQGDTSDVISGVGGIGEKGATEFIAEFGSMREFYRRIAAGEHTPTNLAQKRLLGSSPFTKEEWEAQRVSTCEVRTEKEEAKLKKSWMDSWPGQGRLIYKRNLQLMQLLKVEAPPKGTMKIDLGGFDRDAFADICGRLNFNSILTNFDAFLRPFK